MKLSIQGLFDKKIKVTVKPKSQSKPNLPKAGESAAHLSHSILRHCQLVLTNKALLGQESDISKQKIHSFVSHNTSRSCVTYSYARKREYSYSFCLVLELMLRQ